MTSIREPGRLGPTQRPVAYLAVTSTPLLSLHNNDHRPHQSREQRPPLHEPGQAIDVTARIERRQAIQGLISECRRAPNHRRNTSSEPAPEFWHGTRPQAQALSVQ